MSSEIRENILNTIQKIENSIYIQTEIDSIWCEIKNMFTSEMDKLPSHPTSSCDKINKKYRKCAPFWNENLSNLWFNVCQAENNYLYLKVDSNCTKIYKNELKLIFKPKQHDFDNKFCYYKRRIHEKR